MKYVIELVQHGSVSILQVHVFSEDICHSEFPKHKQGKAVGAGFCSLSPRGIVNIYGKSDSLKLGPHENDEIILDHFFAGSFEQQRAILAGLYL